MSVFVPHFSCFHHTLMKDVTSHDNARVRAIVWTLLVCNAVHVISRQRFQHAGRASFLCLIELLLH